jgi:uncharacterized protein YkwD
VGLVNYNGWQLNQTTFKISEEDALTGTALLGFKSFGKPDTLLLGDFALKAEAKYNLLSLQYQVKDSLSLITGEVAHQVLFEPNGFYLNFAPSWLKSGNAKWNILPGKTVFLNPNKIDFDSLSNSLVDIINNYRIKNKLYTLSLDTSLVRYSKNWGKTLCDRNTLIHSDFTGTKIIGENIYGLFTYGTFMCNVEYFNKQPQIIFNDWRTSIAGHNETMLNKSVTKIGLYIYTEYNVKFKLRTVMVIE